MPSGLSSRDVLWTATPSDTYRTGKTKLTDGIHAGRSSAVPQIDEVLPRSYRFSAGLQRPDRQPSARNRAGGWKWPRHSQDVRRQLGERRALALGERDVPRQALVLELVHDVDEPVAGRVHVRVVDLVRVAGEDDLGVVAHARDDRLHLVRREVLRLVDDDVLVGDAAPADVRERFD